MDNLSLIIGSNIRKYRELNKMTREQLAEILSLDTQYLGQCERGERRLGLSKTIEVIEHFGITANDIISINIKQDTSHVDQYLEEINTMLKDCSDRQLVAIIQCIKSIKPFLKS